MGGHHRRSCACPRPGHVATTLAGAWPTLGRGDGHGPWGALDEPDVMFARLERVGPPGHRQMQPAGRCLA
jgi:hypothetical protein